MQSSNTEAIYTRGFLDNQHALLVAKRMNELRAQNTDWVPTILALMLYPAIQAILNCAPETDLIFKMMSDGKQHPYLADMVAVIEEAEGMDFSSLRKMREDRLELCRSLVAQINDVAACIKDYPSYGKKYSEVLDVLLNRTTDKPASRYAVNQYIGPVVQCIAQLIGDNDSTAQKLFASANTVNDLGSVWDSCSVSLQLIQAHAQIKWLDSFVESSTSSAVGGTARKDYLNAMNKLFDETGTFPGTKELHSAVLKSIVDLKARGYSDENLAAQLNVSTYTYSTMKKTVLAAFNALFFSDYRVLLWLLKNV